MKRWMTLALVASLIGCADPMDRASEISSLRVLAVRAENVFAKPGETVSLTMLLHDGSPSAPRPHTVVWLSGCVNPQGDLYYACYPALREALSVWPAPDLAAGVVPAALADRAGSGTSLEVHVPTDVIQGRAQPDGVVHPYGLVYAFFAACAGELRAAGGDPPLGCFDADGQQLGAGDFEFGYFPVYAYADVENRNPGLQGVSFPLAASGSSCSDDSQCANGEHCSRSQQCIPRVPACASKADECPRYAFSLQLDRASLERAVTANLSDSDAPWESFWVSYYATGGQFEKDTRMVHDPYAGWSADADGLWRATAAGGTELRLWAVLRDSRNGVSWAYQDVFVE